MRSLQIPMINGFICTSWFGTGAHFPLIQEILTYVYARGKGPGPEGDVGTTHWIRGVLRQQLRPGLGRRERELPDALE
ncbi:MAG TPA: hypothetical protein VLK82_08905 [Candidatus Tectomicrobia bacterium]|nr:hypothetical protein [Candidatus Tectomicrobia bacterium]